MQTVAFFPSCFSLYVQYTLISHWRNIELEAISYLYTEILVGYCLILKELQHYDIYFSDAHCIATNLCHLKTINMIFDKDTSTVGQQQYNN